MRIPLPKLLRGFATCSATCWLTSAVPTVKRQDTLRVPSSRTPPVQKTSPLLILFIDLLSFKLETSQVVEVCINLLSQIPLSTHNLFYSRYSGRPAPIVRLFPLRQLMANVGPQTYPRLPLDTTLGCRSPSIPSPSHLHYNADVTPFLMCSGLTVVGHPLDCYSLLSVVFAVFHGHLGHGSLAQDFLSLSTLIFPMCIPQLGSFVMFCLSGYHLPSSVCSLFLAPL